MRPNTAIKYAWFLILLSFGHEFTSAYRVNSQPLYQHDILDSVDPLEGEPFRVPTITSLYRDPKTDPDYFNGDTLLESKDEHAEDDDEPHDESDGTFVQPDKRGWAIVLARVAAVSLGLSVGLSVAGTGMEAWYKIHGCCGSGFPEICSTEDAIKIIQANLTIMFNRVDFAKLTATNLLEDVIQTNYRIKEIWLDLKRIQELQVELLTELKLIKLFNAKWSAIEKQIKSLNDSYRWLTFAQLDFSFKSYWDTLKGTIFGISGIALLGIQAAGTYAFNRYARNQLNKKVNDMSKGIVYKELATARHTKAARVMGLSQNGMNGHIRETAKARQKAKFNAPKFAHALNAISTLGAAVSIYLDIAAIINRVNQCKANLANARNMLTTARTAQVKVGGVLKNISDYTNFVDAKGFQYIAQQLRGQQFLRELEETLTLVKNAGGQSKNLTAAAKAINAFITGINDANAAKTRTLCQGLASGLANVKFLYACYVNRGRLMSYVNERCTNGTKSLRALYNEATKSFNTGGKVNDATCKTAANRPYFSFSDMEKEWAAEAKRNSINVDCILNSASMKADACRKLKKEKKTIAVVAQELKITPDQVRKLTTNCPVPTLSPAEGTQVCKLHKKKWTAAQIADLLDLNLGRVTAHISKCPTVAPPGRR